MDDSKGKATLPLAKQLRRVPFCFASKAGRGRDRISFVKQIIMHKLIYIVPYHIHAFSNIYLLIPNL